MINISNKKYSLNFCCFTINYKNNKFQKKIYNEIKTKLYNEKIKIFLFL